MRFITYYYNNHKFKTYVELCVFYTFKENRFDLLSENKQNKLIENIINGLTENEKKVLKALGEVNNNDIIL